MVFFYAFAAFSAYVMVLKNVNFVFFSVIITSVPCLRSVRALRRFFLKGSVIMLVNFWLHFFNGEDLKKTFIVLEASGSTAPEYQFLDNNT